MMACTLQARPGDVQALKCCIAAAYSDIKLTLAPAIVSSGIFGPATVVLYTSDGVQLSEPNAGALYILSKYFQPMWEL